MSLFKFHWDCGRSGSLDGVFEADDKAVDDLIGTEIHFGEALGKHSEVIGKIEANEIVKLDANQDFIDKAKSIGLIPVGFNPFDYIDN